MNAEARQETSDLYSIEKESKAICNTHNCSSAAISVCTGGGSMKPKFMRSLMPSAFSCSTVLVRLVR